jgi:hypothetical protein
MPDTFWQTWKPKIIKLFLQNYYWPRLFNLFGFELRSFFIRESVAFKLLCVNLHPLKREQSVFHKLR